MADVRIRKLDDWVVATLRGRAERAGRSLEEELRVVLTEAALQPQHEFARRVAALREEVRREHGLFPDSTDLIREDREARG